MFWACVYIDFHFLLANHEFINIIIVIFSQKFSSVSSDKVDFKEVDAQVKNSLTSIIKLKSIFEFVQFFLSIQFNSG